MALARQKVIPTVLVLCVALLSLVAVEPSAVAAARPYVGWVSANTGKTVGGQRITLHGSGFTRVAWVKFGTAYGKSIRVLSSTQLQVTSPAHAAGVVNVTVHSAYGTSTIRIPDRFTFIAPPAITSITPTSGSTAGGARVTVTGARFLRVSSVKFGTLSGTAISVLSSTKLLVTAPAHSAGLVDVRVNTAYGTSPAAAQDHFTFVAPGVPPVSGLAAKAATATSIRLSWTNPTGVSLAGQIVRRAIGATPPTTVNSGIAGTRISGDGSTFIDTGLRPGTQYSYSVFAVTASGSSPTAASATATTLSPSTVTGTVTAAAGGAPLAGVRVEVYQSGDGTPSSADRGTAVTSTDGTYTITGIEPGLQYGVCFDASGVGVGSSTGYQDQCWSGVAWDGGTTPTANLFTLNPGSVTSGINAALLAGGSITGSVSATGPLAGVTVRVYEQLYESPAPFVTSTVTAADGTYEVDGLMPRSDGYIVCFEDDAASSYEPQCWNNTPWTDLSAVPTSSTHIQVAAGTTQGGINAVLAQGGTVTGTITASADGTPLAGVAVSISGSGTGSNYGVAAQTTTAADGTYTLRGIPAGTTYRVCGDPSGVTGSSGTGYLRSCGPSSTAVAVGATTAAGNLPLPSAGGISGTVTAAIGGAPLSGVHIVAGQPGLLGFEKTATTRADGTYSIAGLTPLPSGQSYSVYFSGAAATGGQSMTGYLSSSEDGVSAAPGVFTAVDATLQSAGAIAGTVTALDGGAPLNRVAVELYDSTGTSIGNVWTDANGFYAYPALLPTTSGGYTVCFDPRNVVGGTSPTGYVGNCYKNVEPWLESVPPSGITPVPTTAQTVTGSIDAALSTGGAISGTVTHQGNPVTNAPVFWYGPGIYSNFLTSTDANGNYKAIGLPPSTTGYTICFGPSNSSGTQNPTCYNNQSWPGAPSSQPPAAASPVPIARGLTATGIDGTL